MSEPISFGAAIAAWVVGKTMEGALGAAGSVFKEWRQTRALADALAAALAEFEKCHPDLVRSLFDKTFLDRPEVKAELAKLISVTGEPDASVIAKSYCAQFKGSDPCVCEDTVADFLKLLDAALREYWVFWGHYARRDERRTADAVERLTRVATRGPYSYRFLIETFLQDYLGSPERPVAFGGREAEMLELNRWFANENAQDRLLLTAPAGRGKTAFLARWVAQVPEAYKLIFFPLRADIGTARPEILFPALAAEIGAHMNWKREPSPGQALPEVFQAYIARLWSEFDVKTHEPLTLVLDGLDELPERDRGAVYRLFPRDPKRGLRFIASARLERGHDTGDDWAEVLGWRGHCDTLGLTPLDRDGIRDVLVSLHGAAVGDLNFEAIAERLVELTGGDPLLVGLYARQLWGEPCRDSRFTPTDLADISRGLAGYFDKWVERQKSKWERDNRHEDDVLTTPLLAALAILGQARGPLRDSELKALLHHAGVEGFGPTIGRLLRPFDSFLRGDGRRAGYVFNHPRLADFFGGQTRLNKEYWNELDGKIIGKAEQAYLNWGAAFLADPKLPKREIEEGEFGDYLADHYITHLLAAASDIDDLRPLTGQKWKDFRRLRDIQYVTYGADLMRLRADVEGRLDAPCTATEQNAKHLGLLIRIARILSSVGLYGFSINNVSAEFLCELIKLPAEHRFLSEHQILAQISAQVSCPSSYRPGTESLVAVFPHLGRRGQTEALTAASAITDDEDKAYALTGLAPHLDEARRADALEPALTAASAITHDIDKARVLTDLAPHLDEARRADALEQALTAARAITYDEHKARALTRLAPHLDEARRADALEPALTAASAMANDPFVVFAKVEVLTGLAPHLDEARRADALEQALTAASAITHYAAKLRALTGLAPHLDEARRAGALQQALTAASAITDDKDKTRALTYLAPDLDEARRADALEQALTAASAITDDEDKARALTDLAPHLDEARRAGALQQALTAASAITDDKDKTRALTDLAPHLDEARRAGALQQALTAASAITHDEDKARALTGLAPHLDEARRADALEQALTAASAMANNPLMVFAKVEVLTGLAPHLDEARRADALRQALTAVTTFGGGLDIIDSNLFSLHARHAHKARVLTDLAPHLDEARRADALEQALTAARAITYDEHKARALTRLAPHLDEARRADALEPALTAARAITDDEDKAYALTGLVPHLDEERRADALQQALTAARAITDDKGKARALTRLAPHLDEARRADALEQALTAASAITDDKDKTRALTDLAPHLDEARRAGALEQALTAARAITYDNHKARALTDLAPHLDEARRADALEQALTAARAITYDNHKARALTGLAPHLDEDGLQRALTAARAVTDDEDKAEALTGLAPHLDADGLQQALTAARAITDDAAKAEALTGLAPHLDEDGLQQALTAAKAITDDEDKAYALTGLVPHLDEERRADALQQALTAARAITDDEDKAYALTGLVPHLDEARRADALEQALTAASTITDDHSRYFALTDLAPHLPMGSFLKLVRLAGNLPRGLSGSLLMRFLPNLPDDLRPIVVNAFLEAESDVYEW